MKKLTAMSLVMPAVVAAGTDEMVRHICISLPLTELMKFLKPQLKSKNTPMIIILT